jgi:hypothetical protein
MTTNLPVRFHGVVSSRGDAAEFVKAPGDAILVERGRPRLLLLACPCGCGEQLPVNLDGRAGPAWRYYKNERTGLTIYPSVWRESGCRSHFIIWRDRILLFGRNEEEWEEPSIEDGSAPTTQSVLNFLPVTGLKPFFEIAESLDAVPWDVLQLCRKLVRSGKAREGRGKERGHFGRVSSDH